MARTVYLNNSHRRENTMTTSSAPTTWRRIAVTAITAGAIAVGAGAMSAQVANAEPQEWDIANYDACIAKVNDAYFKGEIGAAAASELRRGCCTNWGGIAQPTPEGGFQCVAPPANAASRTVPQGAIKQTLTPLAPSPGDITQTFTPAP